MAADRYGTDDAAGRLDQARRALEDARSRMAAAAKCAEYWRDEYAGHGLAGLGRSCEQIRAAAGTIDADAGSQGWSRRQTPNGPPKFVDAHGIVRVTIKKGSRRTAGSETPHVELRDAGHCVITGAKAARTEDWEGWTYLLAGGAP